MRILIILLVMTGCTYNKYMPFDCFEKKDNPTLIFEIRSSYKTLGDYGGYFCSTLNEECRYMHDITDEILDAKFKLSNKCNIGPK